MIYICVYFMWNNENKSVGNNNQFIIVNSILLYRWNWFQVIPFTLNVLCYSLQLSFFFNCFDLGSITSRQNMNTFTRVILEISTYGKYG